MTNEDLIPYIHPLTIVLKTLGRVEQKITYGDAAKIVGLWDGKGKYPKSFDRLFKLTAIATGTEGEAGLPFWQWLVNAKTGEPGAGFYK